MGVFRVDSFPLRVPYARLNALNTSLPGLNEFVAGVCAINQQEGGPVRVFIRKSAEQDHFLSS